jgi:hypothetical protein
LLSDHDFFSDMSAKHEHGFSSSVDEIARAHPGFRGNALLRSSAKGDTDRLLDSAFW